MRLQKEGNRDIENCRDRLKAACTDAVGAFLVFLDLLKRNSKAFAKFFLTEAQHVTAKTDAAADMHVNWVGLLFILNHTTVTPQLRASIHALFI